MVTIRPLARMQGRTRAVRRERIRFQMQLLEGKFNPGIKGVRCRVCVSFLHAAAPDHERCVRMIVTDGYRYIHSTVGRPFF